jgi:Cof subfamily protein (haloacid dehalogenase superfamily)
LSQLPFEGRLLVCDMDGTLLDSSSKISTENIQALERFVAGGGLFTVATGRMEWSVLLYRDILPINVPGIVYNGAAIYDFRTGSILWQADLDTGIAGMVRDVIEKFPEISVQVYHGGRSYFVRENEYSEAHSKRERFEPVRTELDGVPAPWFKIIIGWDPRKLKDVEEFLKGYEADGRGIFRQVYSEPHFLELLNPGATKGSALKVLTGITGIDRSRVISMGDNFNDIELIKEAGTGIAVGNAASALKAAADMCCADHDHDAVSEVIRWLEDGRIL